MQIEPMTDVHGTAVLAIYQAGIDEGNATFETRAPEWETFTAKRLPGHRHVAIDGDALLPGGGCLGCQAKRIDAGLVPFQVTPEQPAECIGQLVQGGVVHGRLTFPQVVDQQVADRDAGDLVSVDQLLASELSLGSQASK